MFRLYVAAYIIYKSITTEPDPQMIKTEHFEEYFVRPTLGVLAIYDDRLGSEASVKQMMGIAAQESDLGFYLKQHPKGPGKGFWSVEDFTHDDVWRYLSRDSNETLRELVLTLTKYESKPPHDELINNPRYSAAIARIKLWMVPAPLPEDLEGQAMYWDVYYNADKKNQIDEYLDSYRRFVK